MFNPGNPVNPINLGMGLLLILLVTACSMQPDAETIISKSIEVHGGERFENSIVTFDFRGTDYTVKRQGGRYTFTRTFSDSGRTITEMMSNEKTGRVVNDQAANLMQEEKEAIRNSMNAVVYFNFLPYKLEDAAVNAKYLGKAVINGEPYYEIKVTFDQQGGGEDFQDIFMYWIHQQDYTMDYFAYRYHVNEGGTRFREAYNIRTINGIRFADYHNYGSDDMQIPLQKYDTLFEQEKLPKVSDVDLRDVEVELLIDE